MHRRSFRKMNRMSMMPVRVGFTPTPRTVIRAFGWIAPATNQGAAPLISAGTLTAIAFGGAPGSSRTRAPKVVAGPDF